MNRFVNLLTITLLLALSAMANVNGQDMTGAKRYRFTADHKFIRALELNHPGVIIDEKTRYGRAVVWATSEGAASLAAAGFALELFPDDESMVDWWNAYPTAQQVTDSLNALALRHPEQTRIDTIGYSVQNRPLVTITIGNNINSAGFDNRPGIMLSSTLHGNEKPGVPLLLNFAEWLLDSTAADARLTRLLNECRVLLMPLSNPDGYTLNQRANANGVDLNRNYPCKTSADSLDSPAGRQPETQAIMAWVAHTQPLLAANYHTGTIVVNWPFDTDFDAGANASYPLQPDRMWYQAAADSYAVHNTPMWNNNESPFTHGTVNGVLWYQAIGGLQDYQYRYHNIRSVTVELHDTYTPAASWLPTMWETNKYSILAYCSTIWQGVDVTIQNPERITNRTVAQTSAWGPFYKKLGDTPTYRFLLPYGFWPTRVYSPLRHSTGYANQTIETPTLQNVNYTLMVHTRFQNDSANVLSLMFANGGSISSDSVRFSPYEDLPGRWFSSTMQPDSFFFAEYRLNNDSIGLLYERDWLAFDSPNGVFVPVRALRSEVSIRQTNAIWMYEPITPELPGTGTALQYTNSGYRLGGLTDSPTGNYANSLQQDFVFNPTTIMNTTPNRALLTEDVARISFLYRGNMEAWFDYWVVSCRIGEQPFIVLDTLTGIVSNWQLWTKEVFLTNQLPTDLQVKITVHTDNSVTRDGFTMDELSITTTALVSIDAPEYPSTLPNQFQLTCAPNPFNPTTRVSLSLPRDAMTKVALYDVMGREVQLLLNERKIAGTHTMTLNATALSSGVYFLRAQQNREVRTLKVALVK
ncbi:MAG: DUF2817 domain-containing protein [bacterium]|nr:DUF2817 domain-containing protein [bacterium]